MADIDVDAFRRFERQGWEEVAAGYSAGLATVTSQTFDAVLDAARVGLGSSVLDVACGPGHLAAAAAQRGARTTGVDIASAMVDQARAAHPDLEFFVAPAESLPHPDASLDAVVSNFGLPHFGDPSAVVREFTRIVRPRGRVALTTWCPPQKVPFFEILLGAVMAHGDPGAAVPPGPDFFGLSTPHAAQSFLADLDLGEIDVQEVPIVVEMPARTDLVDLALSSTVRMRALLDHQSPSAMQAIRAQVDQHKHAYVDGDRLIMPMPALLMAATVGHPLSLE